MPFMPKHFISDWMDRTQPAAEHERLLIYTERRNARDAVRPAIEESIKDHLLDLELIERLGGYSKAIDVIRNRLPISKMTRSGDIGEILATEYVSNHTDFAVPLKRLRYKDDRNTSMRGDDVLGFRMIPKQSHVLKVEAKSRANMNNTTIAAAAEALMKHSARPNPATLAFISIMLRREHRDTEAKFIEDIQTADIRDKHIEHLLFTFSGNDPTTQLRAAAESPRRAIKRHVIGLVVPDHQDFITEIFEALYG